MRYAHPALPRKTITSAASVVLAVATLLSVSGCSSTSQPAGLNGKASTSKEASAADRAASTRLTPKAGSFLAGKSTVTRLASTTPSDGDINPYAIWPVRETVGTVTNGDVLVDNFNNESNDQGTGTTIVDVHPDGKTTVFAQLPHTLPNCPGGVGLTTAMVQLKSGWVIVGSTPSTNGKTATAAAGCLVEISPTGQVGGAISAAYLDGPWDATVSDNGSAPVLFVSTTLNGVLAAGSAQVDQGTVVRLTLTEGGASAPQVTAESTVVTGLPERADASAFVKGPTGLALSSSGTLYVANNLADSIDSVPSALTATSPDSVGTTVTSGGQLQGPLGLTIAPDGDLLVANADNGKVVEVTPSGAQVGEFYADHNVGQDPPGNGDLFDLAVDQAGTGVYFVGDDNNDLLLLH
jgi:hypothetical protein